MHTLRKQDSVEDLTGSFGVSGLRHQGGYIQEEFLKQLRGHSRVEVFREMAMNDSTIGASLRALYQIVLSSKWETHPADDDQQSMNDWEFLDSAIADMCEPINHFRQEGLSMLWAGFSLFWPNFKKSDGLKDDPNESSMFNDGLYRWNDFSIRAQDTIYRWGFNDETGKVESAIQLDPNTGNEHILPLSRMLLFVVGGFKGNPEGQSILRNVYVDYFEKKRLRNLLTIGMERDAVGYPYIEMDESYLRKDASPDKKALVLKMQKYITGMRRDSLEGMIIPLRYDENGNKMFTINLLQTGGKRQIDINPYLKTLNQNIMQAMHTDFLLLGHEGVGSFALADSKTNMTARYASTINQSMIDAFNKHAIPMLFKVNGMQRERYPFIKSTDIETRDLAEFGDFIQKMLISGGLTVGEDVEREVRNAAGLPPVELQDV